MKYLDSYRDPHAAEALMARLAGTATRPWTILDACGGAQHLLRFGVDRALPAGIQLAHGPGCPVGALPPAAVDEAAALAARPEVIFCTSGDLLRVPGPRGSLHEARLRGADVRVVYSPLDALALAKKAPDRCVVFFAVGFETTAPTAAAAVREAHRLALPNFRLLSAQLRLAPMLAAALAGPGRRAHAVLAAGHVGTVTGAREFEPIAARFRLPVVITGTDPLDLLDGLARAVEQLERGEAEVENQYARAVRPDGNAHARALIEEVFEPVDRHWPGLGRVGGCGLALRDTYRDFDASRLLDPGRPEPVPAMVNDPGRCPCTDVVVGRLRPVECPALGTRCTPERPLGAPMASPEGTCAAYQRYRRPEPAAPVIERPELTVTTPNYAPRGA